MMWSERDGFAIVPAVLDGGEVAGCIALIEAEVANEAGVRRGGTRDVLGCLPALRDVAEDRRIRELVCAVLGESAFVVRATLFDKTPGANWKVPWHQDLTIAVSGRVESEGYGPWSMKNGVVHVQPPSEVLERMVTVRVHLDPCPVTNGALRVMPGSHRLGRVDQNDVSGFVDESAAVVCEADAGDALVMRPLLLHASSASSEPGHRRVLHFDYAAGGLVDGLEWRMRG